MKLLTIADQIMLLLMLWFSQRGWLDDLGQQQFQNSESNFTHWTRLSLCNAKWGCFMRQNKANKVALDFDSIMWAPSSEFVSSSIPSWQTLTAHAQPFRGARDLAFCLKVPLDSLLVWASSEGSGETERMRRLAWTFAARIGDKYQICLARPMYWFIR